MFIFFWIFVFSSFFWIFVFFVFSSFFWVFGFFAFYISSESLKSLEEVDGKFAFNFRHYSVFCFECFTFELKVEQFFPMVASHLVIVMKCYPEVEIVGSNEISFRMIYYISAVNGGTVFSLIKQNFHVSSYAIIVEESQADLSI